MDRLLCGHQCTQGTLMYFLLGHTFTFGKMPLSYPRECSYSVHQNLIPWKTFGHQLLQRKLLFTRRPHMLTPPLTSFLPFTKQRDPPPHNIRSIQLSYPPNQSSQLPSTSLIINSANPSPLYNHPHSIARNCKILQWGIIDFIPRVKIKSVRDTEAYIDPFLLASHNYVRTRWKHITFREYFDWR